MIAYYYRLESWMRGLAGESKNRKSAAMLIIAAAAALK
jgi:hypothetical protein